MDKELLEMILQKMTSLEETVLEKMDTFEKRMTTFEETVSQKMDSLEEKIDVLEERMDGLDEKINCLDEKICCLERTVAQIKEDTEITRSAVNTVIDWADTVSVITQVSFPIKKQHLNI